MDKNNEIRVSLPAQSDTQGEIRVSVIFPKHLIVAAEVLAALEGDTRSGVIRNALIEYLKNRGMINE